MLQEIYTQHIGRFLSFVCMLWLRSWVFLRSSFRTVKYQWQFVTIRKLALRNSFFERNENGTILTGTDISGAVTATTLIIIIRTIDDTSEFGSACKTSPSKKCLGEKSIWMQFEAKMYPVYAIESPIFVDNPINSGFSMESLNENINGTTPYPNTTTPNQLLADDKLSGNRCSRKMWVNPIHPFSFTPSQNMTANDNANAKSPNAENFERKLMSSAQDKAVITKLGMTLPHILKLVFWVMPSTKLNMAAA